MGTQRDLTDLSNETWQRLWNRLGGLTDAEYFWEPAPRCWTIRKNADGQWAADGVPGRSEPARFTTIAWRLWHLIDMYGENRAAMWLGVAAQGRAIGLDDPGGVPPAGANEALELLDRAHSRWDAHLGLATDALLSEEIGSAGGPFARSSKAAFVLHMLDEFIHHGAEIALLRDLWRAQHGPEGGAAEQPR